MRAPKLCFSLALATAFLNGCSHKTPPPAQQAQAPPLQTGKGTLSQPQTSQQQEKTTSPLASPLPPPSAQSVPLPPPPPPKKVRHRVKSKPAETKPSESAQSPAAAPGGAAPESEPSATQSASLPANPAVAGAGSPIGQLTTGDSAMGEKAKHETADLINETAQGLNAIKRALSTDEKVTALQIHTFLKQAQQALDNGDTDGAHTLATKAKLLLDELTKP